MCIESYFVEIEHNKDYITTKSVVLKSKNQIKIINLSHKIYILNTLALKIKLFYVNIKLPKL